MQSSLPEGWEIITNSPSSPNRPFYVNTHTSETVWERPTFPAPPLPEGWEHIRNSPGLPFYVNTYTREFVSDRPTVPAPRAPEGWDVIPANLVDGRPEYYRNRYTGEYVFQRPTLPAQRLPEGWELHLDSSSGNRPFYLNIPTGKSEWKLPTREALNPKQRKFVSQFLSVDDAPVNVGDAPPDAGRLARIPLSSQDVNQDIERLYQSRQRSISPPRYRYPHISFKQFISGEFFQNIGLQFEPDFERNPELFAYFKKKIKEQQIFCSDMTDSDMSELIPSLFTYRADMNMNTVIHYQGQVLKVPTGQHLDESQTHEILASIDSLLEEDTKVDESKKAQILQVFRDSTSNMLIWKMLLYSKNLQERIEGTCTIQSPIQSVNSQSDKVGYLAVSYKQKERTKTTCGFTASTMGITTLFLQVMGSDILWIFSNNAKCSNRSRSSSGFHDRGPPPPGPPQPGPPPPPPEVIYNDQMLSSRLSFFDLSMDNSQLYAKLNNAISQLYDNNKKYKTGIQYMKDRRPDLFVYNGLNPGINIISIVADGRTTVHHCFIYNMGDISIVMDSWAHSSAARGFLFGRDIITRIWLTRDLIPLLDRMNIAAARNRTDVKDTLIRVFLAPHMINREYYAPDKMTGTGYRLTDEFVSSELTANDANLERFDYTIISINQNFLMFIFIFNFGFTQDTLFGGRGRSLTSIRRRKSNFINNIKQHKTRKSVRKIAKKKSIVKYKNSVKTKRNYKNR